MIYGLPIIGPIIGFVFAFFLAIPLYFLWNSLGPVYFYWLPAIYLHFDFWTLVGLLMLISILKLVFVPHRVSNTSGK